MFWDFSECITFGTRSSSLTRTRLEEIKMIPGIAGNDVLYNAIVKAGQIAYADSYAYVYYASIAFGAISIISAAFLGDISAYMTDKVAVVM